MLIKNVNFKIGADPELFVHDGNEFVSAYGMIEGDKENPFKVELGAVQVDGMALEFNIDPAENFEEFNRNITAVMRQLEGMLPAGHKMVAAPVARFGREYINKQPEKARELGCDPDFNAWTGGVNPTPDGNVPFRTAGGHVHIGWGEDMDVNDPDLNEACIRLIKRMDQKCGLVSLAWDKDSERRSLYGKAGAYRPKPYGVEYRSLSNKWLESDLTREIIYLRTITAIRYSFGTSRVPSAVRSAIDNSLYGSAGWGNYDNEDVEKYFTKEYDWGQSRLDIMRREAGNVR